MTSRYEEIEAEMYLAYEILLIRVSVLYTMLPQIIISRRHPEIIKPVAELGENSRGGHVGV
jgi:hypothetical protein